jgi:hypothetical protein
VEALSNTSFGYTFLMWLSIFLAGLAMSIRTGLKYRKGQGDAKVLRYDLIWGIGLTTVWFIFGVWNWASLAR